MLKEISLKELEKRAGGKALVVSQDLKLEPLEGSRILIDEEPKAPKPAPENKKRRLYGTETAEAVLKAWNMGERTIKEVQEITGLSYATVRKYIPISPEG